MAHRNCFEALDKSLRDVLRFTNENSLEKPFGGMTVVLGGDFRQILPTRAGVDPPDADVDWIHPSAWNA